MYCKLLFNKLDKLLGEKKNLDQIGIELCEEVEDPRGKVIRLIKVHKGDNYLIKNADWLGYQTSKITNPRLKNIENIDIEKVTEVIEINNDFKIDIDKEQFFEISKKIDQINGIKIVGFLEEQNLSHVCYIEPYLEDGFHFITIMTYMHTGTNQENGDLENQENGDLENQENGDLENQENGDLLENQENGGKLLGITCTYAPSAVKDNYVDEYIDVFMYPNSVINELKKFIQDQTGEVPFPNLPRFRKSQHPDWKWKIELSKKGSINRWLDIISN